MSLGPKLSRPEIFPYKPTYRRTIITFSSFDSIFINTATDEYFELPTNFPTGEIFFGSEKSRFFASLKRERSRDLCALPPNATSELDILRHDRDSLSMDGTQVGVLEEPDQVGLTGFLQSHDGRALESEISLEVLSDFTDEPLERQLADQKLSTLLVPTDLAEGDSPGPVAMGLLHTPGGRGRLASSLGGQLLPGSLPSGTLASGLLCTSHDKGSESNLKSRDLEKFRPSGAGGISARSTLKREPLIEPWSYALSAGGRHSNAAGIQISVYKPTSEVASSPSSARSGSS